MFKDTDMNRRRLLALCRGAVGAALLPGMAGAQQKQAKPAAAKRPASEAVVPAGAGRKFFTAQEFALLDEMAEAIIPADANSGGARAAKVAEFIDARLGESRDTEMRQSWRDDLAEIDSLSAASSGKACHTPSDAKPARFRAIAATVAP